MTDYVRVHPCAPVRGTISPPGSKSLTNRALVCAALADGTSELTGVLDSEDSHVMVEAWRGLGIKIDGEIASTKLHVYGCAGKLQQQKGQRSKIFIANSGTTIRFLTAALSTCEGEFELDGIPRMRERPIGDLLTALRSLGVRASSLNAARTDCPPVLIEANGLSGGIAQIPGNISSQYLSGLMMAAPMAKQSITLEVVGELVSVPYVDMTANVMRAFGAHVSGKPTGPIEIEATGYRPADYAIEPDASAASYFWAAAAITQGDVTVKGLGTSSLQGDVHFVDVLEQMGCRIDRTENSVRVRGSLLRGVDVNMADISDTVQTLAAVALFADGPTRVRGVAHNRHKETDRIGDLAIELRKVGARVETFDDGLEIYPPSTVTAAALSTYNDHRMAMSFSLIGLAADGIEIENPGCTAKTYPGYWDDLVKLTNCRMDRFVTTTPK